MSSVKTTDREMSELRGRADTGSWGDAAPALAVSAAAKTDRGRVRTANEDQFLIAELAKLLRVEQSTLPESGMQMSAVHGHLFLVADGMGGYAGGEIASRIAARTVEECLLNSLKWFLRSRGDEGRELAEDLQAVVVEADARVLRAAARQPELAGMGCTLTFALVVGRSLFVAHVGDSRAYLLRQGAFHQLTKDHTLVKELTARGDLLPGQEISSRLRHVITNSVGGSAAGGWVEIARADLEPDDRLLLCTDGLTDLLADDEIVAVLDKEPDSASACAQLVDEANNRGGHDNVTVVVAEFTERT